MFNVFYTALFLTSIVMLLLMVVFYKSRITVYYILLFTAIIIANFGYMQLAAARDLNAAIYANQTAYLGSCFTPFFLLMCMVDLCKAKLHSIMQGVFITFGIVVFTFISSIGSSGLYYKSVAFERRNGFSRLVKEYGPLHKLYPIYLVLMLGMCMFFIVNAFRNRKEVSHVTSILLLVCTLEVIITYAIEKILALDIELIPLSYTLAQIGVLILLRRISLYDISSISVGSMIDSCDHGFIICDSKGKYLGSDIAAKNWFPEISEMKLDVKMPDIDSKLLMQIKKWISGEDVREKAFVEQNDNILELSHAVQKEKKDRKLHCIYIRDDTENQKYTKLVEEFNEKLEDEVNLKTQKLKDMQNDMTLSMADIVENRDGRTGGHIARTSDVVRIFVNYLHKNLSLEELTPEMAECIIKAAPLHDFGKIAIPDRILNKPGKFEPDEYEEMKAHSEKGAIIVAKMLKNIDDVMFKRVAINVAHYHHERWDGSGYPEKIKEEQIPFEARVMALADVFDALVSKRVYKERFGYDKAFQIIEESSGTHFEPILCKAFVECRKELEALYDSYADY